MCVVSPSELMQNNFFVCSETLNFEKRFIDLLEPSVLDLATLSFVTRSSLNNCG